MNSRLLGLLLLISRLPCFGGIELIKQGPDEVILRLKSEAPVLSKVLIQGIPYLKITNQGFRNELAPGYPEIPTLSDLIWVPRGTKPTLKISTASGQSFKLSQDLSYLEAVPSHCGSPSALKPKNPGAYKKTYGTQTVEITEIGFGAFDQFARIKFWPFQYKAAKRLLTWIPEMTVTITFEAHQEKEESAVLSPSLSLASYLSINQPTSNKEFQGQTPAVDLFISHPSYANTLEKYLDFKKLSGRETRIYFVENKTNEQVKEIIRQEYAGNTPPSGVTLVGNIDQIPSWKGSSDNRWTDFYYTALDKDSLPDISLGRIPVHSVEELSNFIDKAIAREKEPRKVEEFLLTAGKDESLGCPKNVTKVGSQITTHAPSTHLTKKYRTEVSTEDVIAAYNANPNIIVYDGHGNRQGMTEIPLLISSLEKLSNTTYPLVLDIACLNANWGSGASPRNFAESILLAPLKGAAGIMASGGSGYGHDFFQTIGELIGKTRQQGGLDSKMNEIGQIILGAKIKHGTQDRTYWNYYGDPSSSVWESSWKN